MAQTIKLKRSSTPSAIPTTSNLELGEVAINTYDGKMYIKKDDGTSPDTIIEVTGANYGSGDTVWADNEKALFGDGGDLEIYHSGTHSFIEDKGTGNLYIDGSSSVVIRGDTGNTLSAVFNDAGGVNLRHNGDTKLDTTATGIDVTGTVTFDGGTTSADLNFGDNDKANFGDGDDLQIYHDSAASYIDDVGAGSLNIRATNLVLRDSSGTEAAAFISGGESRFNYSGSTKLATTSAGIDVTGSVTADGLTVNSGTLNTVATFQSTDDTATLVLTDDDTTNKIHSSGTGLRFEINGSEIGRFDSAGLDVTGAATINSGTTNGALNLVTTDDMTAINLTDDDSTNQIRSSAAGLSLRFDSTDRLTANGSGIDVTGVITTDGMTTSADINFGDNDKAIFGAGSDLQIYHDGSDSYIDEVGTGDLYIRGGDDIRIQVSDGIGGWNNALRARETGATDLFYAASTKLSTTSTGIDVTGEVEADTAHFGTGTGAGPSVADEVVVSGTGSTGLTLHSPDLSNATLAFGSATDNDYAFVQGYYNSGSPFLRFSIQNSEKAKVTSTGLDVTGTVTADGLTADGLTVDGDATLSSVTPRLNLMESDSTDLNSALLVSGGHFSIRTQTDANSLTGVRLNVDNATGDISFREDTGTTAKFFWDASAESLGIGTSNPDNLLHVKGVSSGELELARFRLEGATNNPMLKIEADEANQTAGIDVSGSTATDLTFSQGGIERMRIDSSGHVGVGLTDPNFSFCVGGATGSQYVQVRSDAGNATLGLLFADGFSNNPGGIFYDQAAGVMTYRVNGTERMRIDSNGDVGIGASAQSGRRLHVSTANDYVAKFESTDGGSYIVLEDNGSTNNGNRIGVASDEMRIYTANSLIMSIDTGGVDITGITEISSVDNAIPLSLTRGSASVDQVGMSFDGGGNLRYFGKGTDDAPYWSSSADLTGAGAQVVLEGSTYTGDIGFGNITTTGYIRGPATFTIDPAAHGDDTGTVVIAGGLQVDGTTTTINSTDYTVDAKTITLAEGSLNAAAANGAGIIVDDGSAGTEPTFLYNGTSNEWEINRPINQTNSSTSELYALRLRRSGGGSTQPDIYDDGGTHVIIGPDVSTPTLKVASGKIAVEGDLSLSAAAPKITFIEEGISPIVLGTYWRQPLDNAALRWDVDTTSAVGDGSFGSYNSVFRLKPDGSVNFYDDSGTAKTYWDSVNERFGINNNAPEFAFHVRDDTNIVAKLESTNVGGNVRLTFENASNTAGNSLGLQDDGSFTYYDAANTATPFRIESGAASNSLIINSSGIDVTGTISLGNDQEINMRNQADSANYRAMKVNTSNEMELMDGKVTIAANGTTVVSGSVTVAKGSDSVSILALSGNNSGRQLDFQSFTNSGSAGAGFDLNATSGQGAITLSTTGTERVKVDSTGIDVTGVITTDGMTTSADINFGDDDKAVFGAGSDLQIYHSSTAGASYIDDAGTGRLYIRGSRITLRKHTGETMIDAVADGAVTLYHDNNAAKLATTSAGIDVTGNVTADSSTVTGTLGNWSIDSQGVIQDFTRASANYIKASSAGGYFIFQTGGANERLRVNDSGIDVTGTVTADGLTVNGVDAIGIDDYIIHNGDSNTKFGFSSDDTFKVRTGGTDRLLVDSGGNTLFYNSSGTEKMRWDATNEVLTLGHATGSATYSVDATKGIRLKGSSPSLELVDSDASDNRWSLMTENSGQIAIRDITGGTYPLRVENTAPSNTLYLASEGNVGIGDNNPDTKLHVKHNTDGDGTIQIENSNTGASSAAVLYLNGQGNNFYLRNYGDGTSTPNLTEFVSTASGSDFAFSTNNTEAMRITSTGQVGIGTNAPTTPLFITTTGDAGPPEDVLTLDSTRNDVGDPYTGVSLKFQNSDTNSVNQARIKVVSSNDATDNILGLNSESAASFIFETSQLETKTVSNINGTSTEITVTHTSHTFVAGQKVYITNTTGYDGIYTIDSITSDTVFVIDDTTHNIASSSGNVSYAEPRDSMTIRADGNVGIGTTAPAATLEVFATNDAAGGIRMSGPTSTDATQKVGRIKTAHYTNAEEPFTAILTNAQATTNLVNIGGSSGAENAATEINMYAAADNTTLTGTKIFQANTTSVDLMRATTNIGDGGTNGVLNFDATSKGVIKINDAITALQVDSAGFMEIGHGTINTTYQLRLGGSLDINGGGNLTFDSGDARIQVTGGGDRVMEFFVYRDTDDTGLYEALTLSAANRYAGIYEANPEARLHINAKANGSGKGLYVDTDTRTTGEDYIWFGDDTTPDFVVNTDNRVGIGTASPTSPLTVKSSSVSSADSGIKIMDNSDTNAIIRLAERSTDGGRLHMYDGGVEKIAFYTDGTDNHISAGNVGIGTTSPTSTLDISMQLSAAQTIDYPLTVSSRDDGNSVNQLGEEGVGIKFRLAGNSGATPGDSLVGASIAAIRVSSEDTISTTDLAFFTSQNDETLDEAMRIDSDGNVGIGTNNPDATLRIDNEAGVAFKVTGGAAGNDIAEFTRDVGSTGTVAINSSGGDPQIRFTNGANIFSMGVNSTVFEIADNGSIGTNTRFSIDSSGVAQFEGNVRFPNGTLAAPTIAGINDGNTGIAWLTAGELSLIEDGNERVKVSGDGIDVTGGITVTTSIALPDGSISNPSLRHFGDSDTGLYFPAANAVGFTAGNSRKFYVNNTQAFFQNLSSGLSIDADTTITGTATVSKTISSPSYLEEVELNSTTSGTFNLDIHEDSILFLDTAMTANWTLNVRGDSTTTLDSILSVGQSVTVVCLATQGATPYYNNVIQVDGGTGTLTTKWQGGTAPSAGNASSVDSYSYTIIKTNTNTYTVLGNQTQFA